MRAAEPLQDRPGNRPATPPTSCARTWRPTTPTPSNYTQSLGCWHGFIGQQKLISIKKHFGTTKQRYLYLSGWMVAALRSEFGPLPDQSMHEKTSVPALIEELYTFLRQADARELGGLFRDLDAARAAGDAAKEQSCSDADRQLRNPRRADHRRHRRRLRQRRSDLPAGQEDDRGGRLLHPDRKPGLRREAVRPPGRQGHRSARGLPRQDPRRALRLPGAGRRRRRDRRPHRLARRRPDQADRRHPQAGRPGRPVQQLPRLRRNHRRRHEQRRRHHQPRRQAAASEAPAVATCSSSAPAPAKTAACSTASPRCRTAPTCCGSKPRSRTSARSRAWWTASAKSSRTPSWSTTTARRSTGP